MHFVPSIKEFLTRPYLFIYSFLIFVLPFVFSRETNELYEFPKITFFYTVCTIAAALFLSDLILKPRKTSRVPTAIVLFLVSAGISTLLSFHINTSLFGYYSRFADSFIFYIALAIFYYIAVNVFSAGDFKKLLKVAQIGSVFLFIFALSQYFEPFNFLWGGRLQDRVFSTLGQPNWYAQYILILLGISLYEFLFRNGKIYFIFYVVQFFSLWLTFSMSGLAGFLVLVIFYIVRFLLKEKVEDRPGLYLRLVAVTAITLIIPLAFPGIFRERLNDVLIDAEKVVGSFTIVHAQTGTQENLVSDPGYIRSGLWSGTLAMIVSSPKVFLFGTGPETFPYYFQKFRPASLNYSSEWNYVFNKPHNYYLETWAEQGLIGVFSSLYLLYFLFSRTDTRYKGGVLAFAVTNIFGWPTVAPAVLLWLILATVKKKL
ncbi:hypothetical protein A2380_02965 [candidate division WWE3 bacterium RIFOXYB1_FULL_43_24]|uniref:O-antigen ligase-related domain-containing protein n=1 Tax=candidate division WWE3 bacterium GW2011_GWF1_42_14 TaxID=1619138 RepID=A0A0G1AU32_UNCKA|nr:MAG: hypothetical protein UU92_C0007G0023 [candidate division WWE3 bacterium GW2011_GWA1_42_12]KKS37586.1 MAG: hypothetical protein UV00_C0013G0017 [candidate division WWE3 bacterium GW2011_GWF1_42_14]OGC58718.1 MAG: hypothetical protein A2212_00540 [candidate division WWE3 bacterium RIFOXYA1_FULL_42_9]OGC69057.1 MAG: hypothetical protein A2380_02965 [candidate division WWE3 bacterium RIFOXYB1_FULL_43_24]OGC72233.1 MAG: hypothetical protein A2414_01600 [candidate division WWE3 bacterium RIFO